MLDDGGRPVGEDLVINDAADRDLLLHVRRLQGVDLAEREDLIEGEVGEAPTSLAEVQAALETWAGDTKPRSNMRMSGLVLAFCASAIAVSFCS